MLLPDKVVSIAKSQVGYKEGANNWNKYAKALDSVSFFNYPKQNEAWCSVFVAWCIWTATDENKNKALLALYQPQKDNCGAGCKFAAKYFREHKAWTKTPSVGLQIFFGKEGAKEGEELHTGLVESVGVSTITTIEGNKSNQVKRRSYSKLDKRIIGYGIIKYDKVSQDQPTPTTPIPSTPEKPQEKPQTGYKLYKVKTNSGVNLRIRQKPTTKSKQVGAIPDGKTCKVFDISGNWCKVEYKGVNGYSSKKYLKEVK